MKQLAIFILAFTVITSCSTYNQIIEVDDPYKETSSLKIKQELKGKSDSRTGVNVYNYDYIFYASFNYIANAQSENEVQMELKVTTPVRNESLDFIIYFNIDGQKFKLEANKTSLVSYNSPLTSSFSTTTSDDGEDKNSSIQTTTETTTVVSTFQTMKHTFTIPMEMYDKIAFCEKNTIRAYIGNEGIDIKYRWNNLYPLKKYFNQVLLQEHNKKE